jgi:hypothetical protein
MKTTDGITEGRERSVGAGHSSHATADMPAGVESRPSTCCERCKALEGALREIDAARRLNSSCPACRTYNAHADDCRIRALLRQGDGQAGETRT